MKIASLGYDHVDELFDNADDRGEYLRRCPVTGSAFTRDDKIKPIKSNARRALAAADWFNRTRPTNHRLPLTYRDREVLKGRFDEGYIVALFARSLAKRDWRTDGHVSFDEYAAGILALPGLGEWILETDPYLVKRFPPKVLPGLKPCGDYKGSSPVRTSNRTRGVATGLY
jgi:hypothetical protein